MSLITLFIFGSDYTNTTVLLLLGALCENSWDAEKVRPAYIGERVVTPRTPVGPSLT
ncbi:hypothetical protein T10_1780 [Trichinella papuae]|uniref:Uncharacterized protein n=1 Tax=Trichinella papuae TaxID=268474 RepID=A0A0V1LW82_9BILA|nr:hypothetical protein T10_1780 [Trichinella papuae]